MQQLDQQVNPGVLKVKLSDIDDELTNKVGTFFPLHCRAIRLNKKSGASCSCLVVGIDRPGSHLLSKGEVIRPQRWMKGMWLTRPVTGGQWGINVPSDANQYAIFDLYYDDDQADVAAGDDRQQPIGTDTWQITGGVVAGGKTILAAAKPGRVKVIVRNTTAADQTIGPAAGGNSITLAGKERIERPYAGDVYGSGGTANFEIEELF